VLLFILASFPKCIPISIYKKEKEMNKRAVSIIGSAYGDCGKGMLTDYYCSQLSDPIVVRFNGGAQAGHTVVTPEGQRHVFGHLGSGSFLGAPTYLAEQFIVNPIIFRKEFKKFQKEFGITPKVYVSPYCLVTTPYDMMINQITEEARGDCKHGSCGMGINETIERSNQFVNIQVQDLGWVAVITVNCMYIRDEWMSKRILQNGINDHKIKPEFLSPNIVNKFMEDVKFFRENTTVASVDVLREKNLIFEGAQGLLLDQYHENFPHVTRSSTGIENVCQIAKKIGLKEVEVTYATRWYVTRHGRGEMVYECPKDELSPFIEDKTNIFNVYQENLRFGYLDLNYLCKTIKHDMTKNDGVTIIPSLSVSCLDQAENNTFPFEMNGELHIKKTNRALLTIFYHFCEQEGLVFKNVIGSSSETRRLKREI
jgi:adenylosuccinate synthase